MKRVIIESKANSRAVVSLDEARAGMAGNKT